MKSLNKTKKIVLKKTHSIRIRKDHKSCQPVASYLLKKIRGLKKTNTIMMDINLKNKNWKTTILKTTT